MALTDKLSAIGNAIRAKTGGTDMLTLEQMPTAIEGIQTGGVLTTKTITTNGTYNASNDNADGYSEITVNVPTSGGFWDKDTAKDIISRDVYSITLPNNITKIGNYAFADCVALRLSSLPNSITEIGRYAFYDCFFITLSSLPSGLTKIYASAFEECSRINISSLPSELTFIGDRAFFNTPLKAIEIPANVENIGNEAFRNCSYLTEVTFKGTPTFIGSDVFKDCSKLNTINVPWSKGEVSGAPWGAKILTTINYNYTE